MTRKVGFDSPAPFAVELDFARRGGANVPLSHPDASTARQTELKLPHMNKRRIVNRPPT
jgi:hypothetical protein